MSKKKILSVILAASMVASMTAVTAVSTSAADLGPIRGTLYFDSTGLGGKDAATRGVYYCYAWGSEGGELYSWDNKLMKMTNVEGDLYSIGIPENNSKGEPVNADLVIFHANGGEQTYDTTFSDACFGDTAYVLDTLLENPVDSAKTAKGCAWRSNPSQGAHIAITSTGKVQGIGILATETPESIADAFIENYKKGMDEGLTGYDNPALITDEARANYIAEINRIIEENQQPTDPSDPSDPSNPSTPTTPVDPEQPTTPVNPEQPTVPTTPVDPEQPTEPATQDPYGRIPGLPLLSDMNVPAKDTNRDVYLEAGAPADWDGYFNVYYFAAPAEWENNQGKVEGIDAIGFYWFCGGISNSWPGEAAKQLKDADGNAITYTVTDSNSPYNGKALNVYYGFAPSFATSIIWNNGVADGQFIELKAQTEDIKVDDPASSGNLSDKIYEDSDGAIDGVSVAGCINYIYAQEKTVNGLTGNEQIVNKCKFLFYNPRTGETTDTALKDADGNFVSSYNEYWEETVGQNPYFDMNYDHVNEGEIPTTPEPETLPPTDPATQGATDNPSNATNATNGAAGTTNGNVNNGKGTVNTAEGTVAVLLATVLFAAMGVAFVARKRRESEEA